MAMKQPTEKSQYIEIKNKDGTIKVEVNAFFEKALKALGKSPEKLKTLREQIDEILESEKEKKIAAGPKVGEYFRDTFGHSFVVTGRVPGDDPSIKLRRGMKEYTVHTKDLFEKDGLTKKNITEEILKECEVNILF